VVFASSTDHRRSAASRRARDGLHGSFKFLEPVLKVDGPHELLSRRQRRELMKKDFTPTKRKEEHEKAVSSILLATTA
jgi:hypothetical protein